MKRFILRILPVVMIICFSGVSIASASSTVFPPGILIGDNDGIHVSADGEYFIYADNMEAGDSIKKTLTISNYEENSTFDLTMTASPLSQTGPIKLLEKIHLRLTLDGTELYNGRVYGDDGTNMITNAIKLGRYSSGDTKTMKIELELDKNLPRELFKKKSVAEIRWNFYAVKKTDDSPPKTGEMGSHTAIMISVVLLEIASLFWILNKRKKQQLKGDN